MGTLDKHCTGYKIDDVFKSNALVDIRACNKPVVKVMNHDSLMTEILALGTRLVWLVIWPFCSLNYITFAVILLFLRDGLEYITKTAIATKPFVTHVVPNSYCNVH